MVADNLGTDTDAAAAENAPVMVDYDVGIDRVDWQGWPRIRVADMVHPVSVSQSLKLALAAGGTESAEMVALGEHEFKDHTAVLLKLIGTCAYHQTFTCRVGTGRVDASFAFNLDDAETAGADIGEALKMAEGGYVDTVLPADRKYGIALGTFHELAVYCQVDFSGHCGSP